MNESTDVTDRVRKTWTLTLPDGWTVTATEEFDTDSTPDDADCYSPSDIDAWREDEWHYVGIVVSVSDSQGREWGTSSLWATEKDFPITDENGHATGEYTDPLHDDHLLNDLIPEAVEGAAAAVAEFVAMQAPRFHREATTTMSTTEHSDRAHYVTHQVSVWIENDGEYVEEARRIARAKGAEEMGEFLTVMLRRSMIDTAPWHVSQELAPNDYARIRWSDVAESLLAG